MCAVELSDRVVVDATLLRKSAPSCQAGSLRIGSLWFGWEQTKRYRSEIPICSDLAMDQFRDYVPKKQAGPRSHLRDLEGGFVPEVLLDAAARFKGSEACKRISSDFRR